MRVLGLCRVARSRALPNFRLASALAGAIFGRRVYKWWHVVPLSIAAASLLSNRGAVASDWHLSAARAGRLRVHSRV